jgi:hypothetical protein
MPKLEQETQLRSSRTYDDTLAAGASLETPAVANQNAEWDLNAIRSQVRRIIDPAGLVGTADWFVDLATALDGFGLRQIHDKKLALRSPITPGTNDFTLGGAAAGVLVNAGMLVGGSGLIGVGPSSVIEGAYLSAAEANFTIAGTLGVGLSTAFSGQGILLNKVDIIDDATNEPPSDAGTTVFGLLQALTGTSDGAAVAGGGSENLQISFVKIDPATDNIVSVNLAAGTYHFGLVIQQCFYALDKGSILSGADTLPDAIGPSQTPVRLPWREIDIVSATIAANDPMNVATAVFTGAGAQTIFGSFGTPALPASGAEFRDDARVKIWRNGNLQSKGAGAADNRDCYWVSATQLAFESILRVNEIIMIESPASF